MKNRILIFLVLLSFVGFSQNFKGYKYKRKLIQVPDKWGNINLPNEVLSKLNYSKSDIRVLGIRGNDTIQCPYILNKPNFNNTHKELDCKVLNTVKKGNSYYFEFSIPSGDLVNEIDLRFDNDNFNWNITLEASNNDKWFTILENYQLISINNKDVNFSHTTLNFPDSKFRKYRLVIPTEKKPVLSKVSVLRNLETKVKEDSFDAKLISKKKDKYNNSIYQYQLEDESLVNGFELEISDKDDFYRNVEFSKLEKDTLNKFSEEEYITKKVINSRRANKFRFSETKLKYFQLKIINADNQALNIASCKLKSPHYDLNVRFKDGFESYILLYGNSSADAPNYDLVNFKETIPKNIAIVELDKEFSIDRKKRKNEEVEKLDLNNYWLWIVLALIVAVLAFFSFKMLKED